jgi:hypothetical protein
MLWLQIALQFAAGTRASNKGFAGHIHLSDKNKKGHQW